MIEAAGGEVVASIETRSGAHNTVVGLDGSRMYLGGLKSPFLFVAAFLSKRRGAPHKEITIIRAHLDRHQAAVLPGVDDAVVPAADLDAAVGRYVHELLAAGPEAVAAAKALIAAVWGRAAKDAMPMTAAAIAARRVSTEGQEGLKAFLEKREPEWIKDTKG